MNERIFGKLITGGVALAASVSLFLWLSMDTPLQLMERVPGTDGEAQANMALYQMPEGELIAGVGTPSDLTGRMAVLPRDQF